MNAEEKIQIAGQVELTQQKADKAEQDRKTAEAAKAAQDNNP